MKGVKASLLRTVALGIWLYLGQGISHGCFWVLDNIYALLHKYFPDAFPLLSKIGNLDGYNLWLLWMKLLSFTLGIFIAIYLSVRLSNSRYERIISKTEGFYTIKDGFKLYKEAYAASDIIASAVGSVALILPVIFIPDGFFTKDYSFLLEFSKRWVDAFGCIISILLVFLISLLLHIPAVLISLKRWRASWLTGYAT